MVLGCGDGDSVTRSSQMWEWAGHLRGGQGREQRQGKTGKGTQVSGHMDKAGRGGQGKGLERKRTEVGE